MGYWRWCSPQTWWLVGFIHVRRGRARCWRSFKLPRARGVNKDPLVFSEFSENSRSAQVRLHGSVPGRCVDFSRALYERFSFKKWGTLSLHYTVRSSIREGSVTLVNFRRKRCFKGGAEAREEDIVPKYREFLVQIEEGWVDRPLLCHVEMIDWPYALFKKVVVESLSSWKLQEDVSICIYCLAASHFFVKENLHVGAICTHWDPVSSLRFRISIEGRKWKDFSDTCRRGCFFRTTWRICIFEICHSSGAIHYASGTNFGANELGETVWADVVSTQDGWTVSDRWENRPP